MTINHSADRSPELRALDEKYRKLREARSGTNSEPENSGRPVDAFLKLSSEVAMGYSPSGYLSSAPTAT